MLLVTILISDQTRPPAKAISDLSASSLDLATPGCGRTENTAGQKSEESQVILLMSRAICNTDQKPQKCCCHNITPTCLNIHDKLCPSTSISWVYRSV